ncbi:trafficking protein particle complex subunit 6b-like [Watersipora subatra]|uniref:trafficking protein particle complex subunit 6b-like n=1 Tax=Watersipora subatra TaxID=2589382 RepID=UPI00355BEEEC
MNEDYIFEYLHMEMVEKFCSDPDTSSSLDEKDQVNLAIQKLERLGFTVGQRYIEKSTKDIPRFKDELETMKFVCKDVWLMIYRKQIDNLRTNHHGVYNLHDYRFRLLEQMSNSNQYKEQAPKYLAFPCGFLRGALSGLGYDCLVTAEITKMPACKFLIQILHS